MTVIRKCSIYPTLLAIATFLFCAAPASAKSWQVLADQSHIRFSGIYAGQGFKGEFKNWTATINFDQSSLDTSNAEVEIDLSSALTGNKTYDKTLPTSDWFNIKQQPTAQFSATEFTKIEEAFLAKGTLNLREKTVPVELDFTFVENGDKAQLEGKTTLDRLAFDIGKSSDPTGDWVKPKIDIQISVQLVHKPE